MKWRKSEEWKINRNKRPSTDTQYEINMYLFTLNE